MNRVFTKTLLLLILLLNFMGCAMKNDRIPASEHRKRSNCSSLLENEKECLENYFKNLKK